MRARRRRGRGLGLAGGALAALALLAVPARAYVRYRTSAGLPFRWGRSCVAFEVFTDDFADMTPDATMSAAGAAAAAWSAAPGTCSTMSLGATRALGPGPGTAYDAADTLTFRKIWCGPTTPGGACTYDAAATALTSVFVMQSTGEIKEVDVEVNDHAFIWSDVATDPAGGRTMDLQSVLTHELGHALGFDHPCVLPGATGPRPIDDMGNPAPDCATASAAIREATMYPADNPGDVSRRTLAADDLRALCDVYGQGADAGVALACPADGGTTSDANADSGIVGDASDASDATEESAADAVESPPDGSGAEASAPLDAPAAEAAPDAHETPLATGHGCACAVGGGSSEGATLASLLLLAASWRRPRRRHFAARRST